MTYLAIIVECEDDSDATWLRDRCVPAVEDKVDESKEESRLDGKVEVWWDIVDNLRLIGA